MPYCSRLETSVTSRRRENCQGMDAKRREARIFNGPILVFNRYRVVAFLGTLCDVTVEGKIISTNFRFSAGLFVEFCLASFETYWKKKTASYVSCRKNENAYHFPERIMNKKMYRLILIYFSECFYLFVSRL